MAGNIIPVTPGTANITIGYNGFTTVVPVTIAAAPPPTLPNPSGLAFLQDDFTSYTSTANFQTHISTIAGGAGGGTILYSDGQNAQLAAMDQTVTYNGHQTMQYQFPGGTDANPKLWPTLPTLKAFIWYRAMIRFAPGFTTNGSGPNQDGVSQAYKLLGWGYDDGTNYGSGRIEITNTTQYQNYWGMNNKATNAFSGGNVAAQDDARSVGGNVVSEWSDGEWYQYIYSVDNRTTTGATQFWLGKGSATPALRCTSTGSMVSGGICTQVNAVLCGLNFNRIRGASQSLSLNYGFWEVVDGVAHPNPFGLPLP